MNKSVCENYISNCIMVSLEKYPQKVDFFKPDYQNTPLKTSRCQLQKYTYVSTQNFKRDLHRVSLRSLKITTRSNIITICFSTQLSSETFFRIIRIMFSNDQIHCTILYYTSIILCSTYFPMIFKYMRFIYFQKKEKKINNMFFVNFIAKISKNTYISTWYLIYDESFMMFLLKFVALRILYCKQKKNVQKSIHSK